MSHIEMKLISVNTHDATIGQVNDLAYRIRQGFVSDGLLSGEYSLILTRDRGFIVHGYDELPDDLAEVVERGVFNVDRPLWYWCAIDAIREAVRDCLYREWILNVN